MISIVTPVYNAAAFIRQTMEMVQAQDYTDWELILVDDCSKDNSCEIIEEYLRERKITKVDFIKESYKILKYTK